MVRDTASHLFSNPTTLMFLTIGGGVAWMIWKRYADREMHT